MRNYILLVLIYTLSSSCVSNSKHSEYVNIDLKESIKKSFHDIISDYEIVVLGHRSKPESLFSGISNVSLSDSLIIIANVGYGVADDCVFYYFNKDGEFLKKIDFNETFMHGGQLTVSQWTSNNAQIELIDPIREKLLKFDKFNGTFLGLDDLPGQFFYHHTFDNGNKVFGSGSTINPYQDLRYELFLMDEKMNLLNKDMPYLSFGQGIPIAGEKFYSNPNESCIYKSCFMDHEYRVMKINSEEIAIKRKFHFGDNSLNERDVNAISAGQLDLGKVLGSGKDYVIDIWGYHDIKEKYFSFITTVNANYLLVEDKFINKQRIYQIEWDNLYGGSIGRSFFYGFSNEGHMLFKSSKIDLLNAKHKENKNPIINRINELSNGYVAIDNDVFIKFKLDYETL